MTILAKAPAALVATLFDGAAVARERGYVATGTERRQIIGWPVRLATTIPDRYSSQERG